MRTYVHGNVVLQGQFDPMLKIKDSDEYIKMKWDLENNLKSVFCDADPNHSVHTELLFHYSIYTRIETLFAI